MIDKSPSEPLGLRKQDWDEPSDFGRILPKIRVQHTVTQGDVSLLLGNLSNVQVGKGTTVSHYFNNNEMDHYKFGAFLSGAWRGNGGALLIDNIIFPAAFAGRIHLSPIGWFSESNASELLEIAFSMAGDIRAPLLYYENGNRFVYAIGGETVFHILDLPRVTIDIYWAGMAMDGDIGIHLGADSRWALSTKRDLIFHLAGEYRYIGSDYHPALLNPFYDMNRYRFYLSPAGEPGGFPTGSIRWRICRP